MPTIKEVGNEIAEIPIGDLLFSVARGIAEGQRQLDLTSVATLLELSKTFVDIVPEIAEVISPQPLEVDISGRAPILVTGARVSASASEPVRMTALQAGLTPTFYQFTEANIELKLSIQARETQEEDSNGNRSRGLMFFGSNVNFRTQNQYSYNVESACVLKATLRPVPPPQRLIPATVTVNTLGPQPVVTINA